MIRISNAAAALAAVLALPAAAALPVPAPTPAPSVESSQMVSAADRRATEAGLAMLRQGGSALDAAAATLLALTVVEPQSSGIGGGGLLVYQAAGAKSPATFDGRETAPLAATERLFVQPDGSAQPKREAVPGGKSVGVPGNIAMLALAHAKYGKLPWAALFAPAIALARGGFEVTPRLANSIAGSAKTLARQPEAAALFLNPDGTPKVAGTRIVNTALAATLESIAQGGPRAFYTGPNAAAIVAAVRGAPTNTSSMTLADVAGYKARARDAVCSRYRSFRICSMGPPSAGGIALLAILGQLQGFDMAKLGPDSPVAWHLFVESERLAFADRAAYGGDRDFVDVPVAGLIDPAYHAARGRLIGATATMASALPGSPKGAPRRTAAAGNEIPSTSSFAAVDARGNVASLTSTVEGPFGSGLVAGGYILNNELTDFTFLPTAGGVDVANRVQPGKRPRSSMSPTIVYDARGRVVLAIGAAGGQTIPAQVAKAIIGVLDWHLPVAAAIALPLAYASDDLLIAEAVPQGAPLAAMLPALQALGHRTASVPMPLKANGIERLPSGKWRGGADVRSEGVALGL